MVSEPFYSTTSESSGWESDENEKGKIDTFGKIRVEIKDLAEVSTNKSDNFEMIKLSGPLQAAPVRKVPRPGRSPRTIQPSPLTVPYNPPKSPLLNSTAKFETNFEESTGESLDKSVSEKSRTPSSELIHSKSPTPALSDRPLTPLKTGGSLSGENINWANMTTQSSSKFGAPIASVESLSPTCEYMLKQYLIYINILFENCI